MTDHAEKDKAFHAQIAPVYDYLTNEPRAWPNELLFRPIDRRLPAFERMLDLGCGTGQMIGRYGMLARRVVGVDHSRPMLAEAERKYRRRLGDRLELVESDVGEYLRHFSAPPPDFITCVGFLHHLQPQKLWEMLARIHEILAPGGHLLIAEPVHQPRTPRFIDRWNRSSILMQRLRESMPPAAEDPDEEPLDEATLFDALGRQGFRTLRVSRGFELFHHSHPVSLMERLLIRGIYAVFRHRGDVMAVLARR